MADLMPKEFSTSLPLDGAKMSKIVHNAQIFR